MLRTNLSTRPFYNIRAVQVVLGAFTVVVMLMTLYNAIRVLQLATRQRSSGARAVAAQQEAQRLRTEAARIRSQVDTKELETVSAAAREANAIIDMRAFSWSELFSQIEATLPQNARVTAVQPEAEKDGRFKIDILVEARRVEDLEKFFDALEMTGAFHNVLATSEQTTSDGLIEAVVEAVYAPTARGPAPSASTGATTRPNGAAGD